MNSNEPISTDEYRSMVADMMRENALQTQVEQLAQDLGWMVYHTHDSRRSNPGWPDLALANPAQGRFMVRELKTTRGRLTPKQREWIEALTKSGVDAGVWRPSDLVNGTVLSELRA